MVSRDGAGLAEYKVSFEQEDTVHGEYSYGTEIGNLPSSDWDSGSDRDAFVPYPAQSNGNAFLFIMMDPDFSTGTNPGEVGQNFINIIRSNVSFNHEKEDYNE